MPFDTKLIVLLRDDLLPWQELNVTTFLASGLAAARPDLIGQPYLDGDDVAYLPMFIQPAVVLTGAKDVLVSAHSKALGRGVPMSVYTADMFTTGDDQANRDAVRAVPTAGLDLVGLALHAPKNVADRITKGAQMHP